jgi:chromosome segregation ATPase
MKKAQLILIVLAGLLSFASTFTVSWVIKKNKAVAVAAQQAKQADSQQTVSESQRDFFGTMSMTPTAANLDEAGLSERELQSLIYDIRSKLKEHRDRQKAMDAEAERIEISRQSLQEDIDRLNELQNKLNLTLAEIHQKETALKNTMTEIDALEKDNFRHLASMYEKMDATQAGRIMTTMATGNQLKDSVKILYYMNERMAGKLLSEIAAKQPELASVICTHLKHAREMN